MSLYKIPLILSGAAAFHVAITPPNSSPAQEERTKFAAEGMGKKVMRWWPVVLKSSYWFGAFWEVAVILSLLSPSEPTAQSILSFLSTSPARLSPNIYIGPAFLFAWIVAILGSWIRWECFRTLGRLFTFELSIRDQHHLVTAGPYSFVRHPSYTGAYMSLSCTAMMQLTPGSWLLECGMSGTILGGMLVMLWVGSTAMYCALLFYRTIKEDEVLQEVFEQEWDEWAERVPYRLLPYVY
ncbi:hypothetical protein JAAARDRAFT_535255 [Jaapia argillacea MUCL 33604]|uniref:Protein-S-isoprenylcysteine O-methyltransferase n=1 Tax=Jaapia argillacea MUCL 33604 TaxID=933084 RepID=A0A067PBK5_9AGAM|nr:hypothetical protein JAAARDRAFT_535255 [Jaapia argillacea MUCL 33604]